MIVGKVSIEGIKPTEHIKKFGDVRVRKALDRGLDKHMRWAEKQYRPYPPTTAANRPPGKNGRWYVRNFGWKSKSGKSDPVSEQLSKKWNRGTSRFTGGVRGTVENAASYAEDVQGEKQKRFHGLRGWKKVSKVFDTSKGRLIRTMETEVGKLDK